MVSPKPVPNGTVMRFSGGEVHFDAELTNRQKMDLNLRRAVAQLGKITTNLVLSGKDGEIAKFVAAQIENALSSSCGDKFKVKICIDTIMNLFPGCNEIDAFVRFANVAKKVVDEVYKADPPDGFGWGDAINIVAYTNKTQKTGDCPCKPCDKKQECEECLLISVNLDGCPVVTDPSELQVDVVAPPAEEACDWLNKMDPDPSTPTSARKPRPTAGDN